MERALEAGVKRMVVPSIDVPSIERVIALAERYEPVYAAVGIHPNDIPQDQSINDVVAQVKRAAQHPKVVAVGEIGLDYHWDTTPQELQHQWLKRQLDLANELALPVILHNRESTADLLELITNWVSSGLSQSLRSRPGVLHSVSASWSETQVALDAGFYVGFSGPITYKNAEETRNVAARAPGDRIVVETDAPFLSPHPHRGQRNEPSYVTYTVERLAEARGIDVAETHRLTTENACRLFGWSMATV